MKVFVSEEGKVGRLHTIVMNLIELFDKRMVKKKKKSKKCYGRSCYSLPCPGKGKDDTFPGKNHKIGTKASPGHVEELQFLQHRAKS